MKPRLNGVGFGTTRSCTNRKPLQGKGGRAQSVNLHLDSGKFFFAVDVSVLEDLQHILQASVATERRAIDACRLLTL